MTWQRRGGKLYFYRSFRLPCGRVRNLYFGSGQAAEWAAILDLISKTEVLETRQVIESRSRLATSGCEDEATG